MTMFSSLNKAASSIYLEPPLAAFMPESMKPINPEYRHYLEELFAKEMLPSQLNEQIIDLKRSMVRDMDENSETNPEVTAYRERLALEYFDCISSMLSKEMMIISGLSQVEKQHHLVVLKEYLGYLAEEEILTDSLKKVVLAEVKGIDDAIQYIQENKNKNLGSDLADSLQHFNPEALQKVLNGEVSAINLATRAYDILQGEIEECIPHSSIDSPQRGLLFISTIGILTNEPTLTVSAGIALAGIEIVYARNELTSLSSINDPKYLTHFLHIGRQICSILQQLNKHSELVQNIKFIPLIEKHFTALQGECSRLKEFHKINVEETRKEALSEITFGNLTTSNNNSNVFIDAVIQGFELIDLDQHDCIKNIEDASAASFKSQFISKDREINKTLQSCKNLGTTEFLSDSRKKQYINELVDIILNKAPNPNMNGLSFNQYTDEEVINQLTTAPIDALYGYLGKYAENELNIKMPKNIECRKLSHRGLWDTSVSNYLTLIKKERGTTSLEQIKKIIASGQHDIAFLKLMQTQSEIYKQLFKAYNDDLNKLKELWMEASESQGSNFKEYYEWNVNGVPKVNVGPVNPQFAKVYADFYESYNKFISEHQDKSKVVAKGLNILASPQDLIDSFDSSTKTKIIFPMPCKGNRIPIVFSNEFNELAPELLAEQLGLGLCEFKYKVQTVGVNVGSRQEAVYPCESTLLSKPWGLPVLQFEIEASFKKLDGSSYLISRWRSLGHSSDEKICSPTYKQSKEDLDAIIINSAWQNGRIIMNGLDVDIDSHRVKLFGEISDTMINARKSASKKLMDPNSSIGEKFLPTLNSLEASYLLMRAYGTLSGLPHQDFQNLDSFVANKRRFTSILCDYPHRGTIDTDMLHQVIDNAVVNMTWAKESIRSNLECFNSRPAGYFEKHPIAGKIQYQVMQLGIAGIESIIRREKKKSQNKINEIIQEKLIKQNAELKQALTTKIAEETDGIIVSSALLEPVKDLSIQLNDVALPIIQMDAIPEESQTKELVSNLVQEVVDKAQDEAKADDKATADVKADNEPADFEVVGDTVEKEGDWQVISELVIK